MVLKKNIVGKMITDEKWLDELQKCMDSPYYLFTNYITVNNEKVKTFLTEKEFNTIFYSYVNNKNKLINNEN